MNWSFIYIHVRIQSRWEQGESWASKIGFWKYEDEQACRFVCFPMCSYINACMLNHTYTHTLEKQCHVVKIPNGFWLIFSLVQHTDREVHPLSSSDPLQSIESLTELVDLHSLRCYPLTTWSMARTEVLKWGLQVIPGVCQVAEEHLTIILPIITQRRLIIMGIGP